MRKFLAGVLAAIGYPGIFYFGAAMMQHPCGIVDRGPWDRGPCVGHLAMYAGNLFVWLVIFAGFTVVVADLGWGKDK